MLNVLYLLNHAGKAGTERYVQTLIEKMHPGKINAFFAYNQDGLLRERLEAIKIPLFKLTMKHPFDLVAAWKLSRYCRKHQIDLIHTHYLRENYIALLSRLFNPRTKVIYTNHFILPNTFLLKLFNRVLTLLQGRIIAVCTPGKDMLIQNGNRKSIIDVVYNSVDPGYWKALEPSTLRQEFNIDQDEFVMLCASRFAHDKGHAYLVRTIYELKRITTVKFKVVLAGDGPLLEDTKKLVSELGLEKEILFIGFRKDIKNLYQGSDLYFNSSEHEALSFLIIEALAAGLPVAATDMGGNDNIINKKTDCGILLHYDDPHCSSRDLKLLIEDRKRLARYRENAFKAIEEYFNIDKNVQRTYEIMEAACGKKA